MVDIHNHLLPGLDDGSPDLETSIAMARMAAADGITHVVCTPHANNRYLYDPFRVEDLITDLRARLAEARIPLQLVRGADFHLTYENIQEAFADPARFSIAGQGYLMTELPDYGSFSAFDETYYELHRAGMTPVITHPERNPTLQENPDKLLDWLRLGSLLQVTAGSVLGHMGKKAQRISLYLLENHWVHFIATDAHNLTSRPPLLAEAHVEIARRFGSSYADTLCISNPAFAIAGKPLPVHTADELRAEEEESMLRRPWWQRFFAR